MKRILKSELDKFYTKETISKELISNIDVSSFDIYIDPCFGDGSFFNNVIHENKIGIDILPTIKKQTKNSLTEIIQCDFLEWNYSVLDLNKKIITISNPPFGKQGSLALKFIKRCSIFCDTIAFILPLSFIKESFKDKIPEFFHLEYEEILPEDSFLLNDDNYNVKCVFQVWSKKNIKRQKNIKIKPIGFKYTKNKNDADFSVRRVGVYAGKAFKETNKSDESHYFIIVDDKTKIDNYIDILFKHEWIDYTVGPRSISKNELNNVLNNL